MTLWSIQEGRLAGPSLPQFYDFRNDWQMMQSSVDHSVNFTRPALDNVGGASGIEECRFVYRPPNPDFTVYLSCQSACAQGCRMCWLTNTGQTAASDLSIRRMKDQAFRVLEYAKEFFPRCVVPGSPTDPTIFSVERPGPAVPETHILVNKPVVNFAFMARGEPLASQVIQQEGAHLLGQLASMAARYEFRPRFKISTIMPIKLGGRLLQDIFCKDGLQPDIYWSVYSAEESFRRRWLPSAMDFDQALDRLVAYQRETHKIVRLHWAFIKDENSDLDTVTRMCAKLRDSGLRFDVNIVRYNPSSPEYGEEGSEVMIEWLAHQIRNLCPGSQVTWVSRVGPDVFASCGMFVKKSEPPPRPPCVSPNGRTDAHKSHVRMKNSVMVCSHCEKP